MSVQDADQVELSTGDPTGVETTPSTEHVAEDDTESKPKRGRKKGSTTKPSPNKSSPKKVEKPIVVNPNRVTTRKTSHSNWSDVIYGPGEKYKEGDTLAVRAPKESGDLFWLCAVDGIGTQENDEDLEITWYEAKGTGGVYVEGEEDDINADSVICKTRLNIGPDGTWILPQVEQKSIRDTLKLESDESSEVLPDDDDKSDETSFKQDDDQDELPRTRRSRGGSNRMEKKVPIDNGRPKREQKRKRHSSSEESEPKPKRQYKKREKKATIDETPEVPSVTEEMVPDATVHLEATRDITTAVDNGRAGIETASAPDVHASQPSEQTNTEPVAQATL